MKLDCTGSSSAADETLGEQTTESQEFPEGKHVAESDNKAGTETEVYRQGSETDAVKGTDSQSVVTSAATSGKGVEPKKAAKQDACCGVVSWHYLFVHHTKAAAFEEQLQKDDLTYFVHKTLRYVPRHRNRGGVRKVERPTVSGLIFIQGNSQEIQQYLDEKMPPYRLCKNCSTGKVATIPCSQMEPFMRVAEIEPERLRFLLRPFVYYAKNRTLLRIVSGDYAGLEGYVIRIARDRKLVMDVGGMAVAISGIHAERFEEVHKNEANKTERATFYKRSLQERNAFIDRYFHPVKSVQEVAAQAENINILLTQTLVDVSKKRLELKDACDTFCFMVEEIGYYYAPFLDRFKEQLNPIFEAGQKVMAELEKAIGQLKGNKEVGLRYETEYDALQNHYGYLFD